MKKTLLYILSSIVVLSVGCFDKDSSSTDAAKGMSIPENLTELIKVDLEEGKGDVATAGTPITVHYTGWLFDAKADDKKGKKFDSSLDRNQPFPFRLGSGMVIKGWDQGVEGMKVGGKRRLIIPADLAYGSRDMGPIPAGSTLVFDVELLAVKK